jgi:hypothetical protein
MPSFSETCLLPIPSVGVGLGVAVDGIGVFVGTGVTLGGIGLLVGVGVSVDVEAGV